MISEIRRVRAHYVAIHMAGDIEQARRVCRRFAMQGECVQIMPCEYIYTGGLETGFSVRFINYPRFPRDAAEIEAQARSLAFQLCRELSQISFTIETPAECIYYADETYSDSQ